MTRPLETSLKALEVAVNNLKNEKAAEALKTGTNLLKLVKPGDALTAEQAQNLVTFFDEELEVLYSLLPQPTVKFSMAYFMDLVRVFKAEQRQQLWQDVGGKGILVGLLTFMHAKDTGVTTYFDKTFVIALCKLLNSGSSSKINKLSTSFRRCVASFLTAVTAKDEGARKWMLESKVLGIVGLSDLIAKEIDFGILDACLEIAARLAPKRSDPQARRAFFTDVFNSKSAKAAFGEEVCKRLMRVMEQPVKGRPWFEISDQLLAEMGGEADRLQRFVAEYLVVSGQTFSGKNASVRMYLGAEITFNAFLLEDEEEVMITTSYDNLVKIQIDFVEGSANAQLVLKSPPTWENPNELSSHTTATVIIIRLSVPEITRFQKILKLRGQAAKLVARARPTKKSFSLHPTQLGQSNPVAPPPLQAKAAVLKSFIPSPTPVDSSRSPLTPSKIPTCTDPEKPAEVPQELYDPASRPSVPQQPHVSSHAKTMVKTIKNGVRGGVIIDSDDNLGEEPLTKPVSKPGSKRKAPELSDMDEELRSPEPARKKLHLEKLDAGTERSSAKKGLHNYSMTQLNRQKPLPLDDSTQANKPFQAPVSATSSKPLKPTVPHNHSRINGTRTKDGTRPTAASTPPRNGLPTKADVPRSVQELSQRHVKETLEAKAATLPIRGANKANAKPEKAIWEAEDFSQKAVLMFPLMGTALKEKSIVDKAVVPDYHGEAEDAVLEDDVEVVFMPDVESAVVEDVPVTPSPPKFARKLDTPVQGDGFSSPIRPIMALKRKLRDADTLSQRLHAQIPPTSASHVASVIKKGGNATSDADGEQIPGPKRDDLETIRPVQREAGESRRKPETGPLRPFLPIKHNHKRRPIVDWAVPINQSRPGLITSLGNVKQPGVEKSSKGQPVFSPKPLLILGAVPVGLKKGVRDADKEAPKHQTPPPVVTTDDDSDSEAEERAVTAAPKSDVDAIAEVLTAIQDTILGNIQGKFTGMRREAGLARANLLENAVVDMQVMQENHDKSFSRFMRLEEKCGEVTQDIVGTLEDVDAANQEVIANLNAIIREHDGATAAFRAARKPLFSKLPQCLEVQVVF